MLPMVSRATQEVLALVPRSLREASLALGVPRWRTVYSIVLPTAIGGILTGVVLAVARVAGETAPICSRPRSCEQDLRRHLHASRRCRVAIFSVLESPDPNDQAAGWAAALVLIGFVLVMNILAKTFAGRKRRSLEGKRSKRAGPRSGLGARRSREPPDLPAASEKGRGGDQGRQDEDDHVATTDPRDHLHQRSDAAGERNRHQPGEHDVSRDPPTHR